METIQERLRLIAQYETHHSTDGHPLAKPQKHLAWEAADTIDTLTSALAARDEEIERLRKERDEARLLVTEANNSLYGSQGYFHSLNGGPFDKYHLANGIESLKANSRAVCRAQAEIARQAARIEVLEGVRTAVAERAAQVAKDWLDEWAADLWATFESYVEAQNTGKHSGRRIDPPNAKMFAGQFRERAEAVAGCADQVAAAIRARAARAKEAE